MKKKNQRKRKNVYQKPQIDEVNFSAREPTGAAVVASAAAVVAADIIPIGTS